ncbi:hypothetical protein CBR_g18701 [Chara braunii]|uniref:GIY-YIG domain-containing protein n=1 Tax=Chara braunii TaxID=69332 RepID=A0A388KW50_CHABU|nr:hypothetical protein CBR_g18701 [Chara braunii]|eukprot:GBG74290.1 hypothetical protein CBR_g18701 [Chara braunii]
MAASTAVLTPTSLCSRDRMAISVAIANSPSPLSAPLTRIATATPCIQAAAVAAADVIPGCHPGHDVLVVKDRVAWQPLRHRLLWKHHQQHLALSSDRVAKQRFCRHRSHHTGVRAAASSSSESVSESAQSSVSETGQSAPTPPTVPKWKQKLEAANARAELTRRLSQQKQDEYRLQQQHQRSGTGADKSVVRLRDLEYQPYVTEEGKIVDCTKAGAKASVFAVFDEDKTLQYVGMSRQVYQSMRLHFARMPSKCHFVKVVHIASPSRAVLESIQTAWITENDTRPPGNDGGEIQHLWENALDCKPLMTDEEKELIEKTEEGPKRARTLKNVARRIESQLVEQFKLRNVSETLRFDPKLKEKGLLDLKSTQYVPDTSVPTAAPAAQASA